jgi:hypothetical protein
MTTELERLRLQLAVAAQQAARYDKEVSEIRHAIAAEEARIAEAAKAKYPAEGSAGWIVGAEGCTHELKWIDSTTCAKLFDSGNWYATEREAVVARDAWLAFNKLRKAGLRVQIAGFSFRVVCSTDTIAAFDALPPEQRAALAGEP